MKLRFAYRWSTLGLRLPVPRSLLGIVFALALFAVLAAPAGAQSGARAVVVVDTTTALEGVRHGTALWLQANLLAESVKLVPYERARGTRAPQNYAAVARYTKELGAEQAVYATLFSTRKGVAVELRLIDSADAGLIHYGRIESSLGELGESLRAALADLVEETGGDRSSVERQPPPRVDELSIYQRAYDLTQSGRLHIAWRSLAGIKTRTAKELRAAIDRANKSPERSPAARSRLATASGRRDTDWLRLREALRKTQEPEVLLAGGDAAMARQNGQRAAEFYENAVRFGGSESRELRSEALLGWASALESSGNSDEAREVYERLAVLDPENPAAFLGQAELSTDGAAPLWRRAGDLYAAAMRPRAAKRAYDKAQVDDPSVLAPMLELCVDVGTMDDAKDHLADAKNAGLTGSEFFAASGAYFAAVGDSLRAEKHYRSALEERSDPRVEADLALLLMETDRSQEAVGLLSGSLARRPHDGRVAVALALAYEAAGETPKAIAVLEGMSAGATREGERNFQLGRMLLASGDSERATDLLESFEIRNETREGFSDAFAKAVGASGDTARVAAIQEHASLIAMLRGSGESSRDATLDQLTRSLPKSAGDAPVSVIGILGIEEAHEGWGHVLKWFTPWQTDFSALHKELSFSLARRYEVLDVEPPASLRAAADRLLRFEDDLDGIVGLNEFLSTDGLLVAQVSRDGSGAWLEVRLVTGDEVGEAEIFTERVELSPGLLSDSRWNRSALVGFGFLLLLFAIPPLRGWGTLIVTLDEESANSAAFYNIQLNRRANRSGPGAGRLLSRFTRRMVGAETIFRFLPARTYHVGLTGSMQDSETGHTIGNSYEEKSVRVIRGQTITLHFDCKRSESALEVSLHGFDPAGPPALVSLSSAPGKIQTVNGDSVVFFLPDGSHEVVVGYIDRAYRKTIRIEGLSGGNIGVDVGEDGHPVFENCSAAVKPFVLGDLEEAARILVDEGQESSAMQILGEFYRERGDHEQAAHFFKAVGMREQAAEAGANTGDAEYSAKLFEEAGDYQKAAEQHRQAGDLHRAAAAHEAAYEYDAAIECYRQAGDLEAVVSLLERTGDYYEAARTSVEANDLDRAITNFQRVGHKDSVYGEACRTLAHIFAERGEYSLAVERLEEAVAASGGDDAPLELMEQMGHVYEKAADFESALATFETIRKRDFHYEGLEERLSRLRPLVNRIRETSDPGAVYVADSEAPGPEVMPEALGGDRYEILEELGRGGMGVVYKAQDSRLHRTIALKQLHENVRRNPTAVQLFLREARAAASLNHQNIVTLYDVDDVEGNYYFTMELLEGQPLDAILHDRERLSPKDALRIAVQICNGLHYAHEQRVVHRDIKTSNLFFTHDRVVKIMDFGLAKMIEEVRRAATMIGGTPYYMSPEQAAGGQVDHRADIYSLGVTLFELVTGSVPFKEGHVAYHHQHTPPPDPRDLAPDVPHELATLIQHMMGKLPEDRPSDAAVVGAKLVEIYQGLSDA